MSKQPAGKFHLYPTDAPFLERIPGRFRRALEAIDADGLSYVDAAKKLTDAGRGVVHVGTVKSRVHRARMRILAMREATAATEGAKP
jgi:DNA-directed RNA polymerase specialized sigma24 family protein